MVTILLDGVLTLSKSVPKLIGLVPGGGHDLPVVSREGDGEHVLGVILEPASSLASGQIPEPQVHVPGPRQGKVSIPEEDAIVSNIVPRKNKQ